MGYSAISTITWHTRLGSVQGAETICIIEILSVSLLCGCAIVNAMYAQLTVMTHQRRHLGPNAIIVATPPPLLRVPASPGTAQGPSPADFKLGTLTYFHYVTTTTSLTLPGIQDPPSAKHHWQMHVVLRALRRHWLMYGLLAICAHHLAALADRTTTKRIHRKRGMQFSSGFSAGLGQTTGCDLGLEAAEIEKEAEKSGE